MHIKINTPSPNGRAGSVLEVETDEVKIETEDGREFTITDRPDDDEEETENEESQ